jgi:hypothetical protein
VAARAAREPWIRFASAARLRAPRAPSPSRAPRGGRSGRGGVLKGVERDDGDAAAAATAVDLQIANLDLEAFSPQSIIVVARGEAQQIDDGSTKAIGELFGPCEQRLQIGDAGVGRKLPARWPEIGVHAWRRAWLSAR